jgi:hemerythrin
MPIAIWTAALETGNPTVDKQHKRLFEMVNDLHHSIIKGDAQDVMGPVLKRLANYTVDHFGTEEALMQSTKYPNLGRHKAKHVELTKQVLELVAKFDEGKLTLPSTLSKFLTDWLTVHIRQEDMELIKWVQQQEALGPKG